MTTYDLTLPEGEDLAFTVTVYDSTGALVDLTSYTAKMQFKPNNLGTAVISLSETSGLTLGGVAGTIAVLVPAATTLALEITEGVYDIQINSGTALTIVLGGAWIVERAISQ